MKTTNTYFLVLDIETSKEMSYDEKLKKDMPCSVWLSYGVCNLYNIRGEKVKSCLFREWEKLDRFFKYITNSFYKTRIFCFVHNLSYEFDFLIKNLCKPEKFICNGSHKVISAILKDYPNIDFHCSYQLSNKSLRKIGDMLGFPKLDSEYRTIYPNDEVTEEEWKYCIRDCDVVAQYILLELKDYNLLMYLPLTSTGKVRRDFKNMKDDYKCDFIWDTLPPENCYNALVKVFNGAITMSNPRFTNRLITGKIKCFDEKSKYPSVVLVEQFPYTIKKLETFDNNSIKEHKFWIAKIEFNDIVTKFDWGFLSYFKMEYTDEFSAEFFNGKLLNCKKIIRYITNVDFETINMVYNYSSFNVLEFYACDNYNYLPQAFIELVKKYAQPKYELKIKMKNIEEDTKEYRDIEIEYMKSKNKLNSIYGMMVQKLMSPTYILDDFYLWKEVLPPYEYSNKRIGRNFLYGIYITSYSRYDLIKNIIHNCPNNFLYCDTDSIKYIDTAKPFEDMNKRIPTELDDLPYLHNFNLFEEEENYTKFITYGAKKYGYEKNGKFHFTVAGLPKTTQINSFDNFKLGTVYKDCKKAKRYIYKGVINDYDEYDKIKLNYESIDKSVLDFEKENDIETKGGIAIFDTDYSLNMGVNDLAYIKKWEKIWKKKNKIQGIEGVS